MRRIVLVIAVAALSLVASLVAPGTASAASGSTVSMESEFVSRLNSLRAAKGLAPLSVDAELTGIARRWAAKMAADGRISHNPDFPNQVSQNWVKLGENVGTGPEVQSVHEAFVASPTHYKNMVDGAFTRIGVGVVIGPKGALYTAHQFMRLASDDVASAVPQTRRAPRPPAASPAPTKPAAAPRPAARPTAPAAAGARPAVVPARIALSLEQSQGLSL